MINEKTLGGKIILNLDRLLNILLGGELGVCLSTRAYINSQVAKPAYNRDRWIKIRDCIDTLFFWQEDHCKQSYLWEHRKKRQWVQDNLIQ